MPDVIIKSRRNPLAVLAREVRDGRRRELIFIEGVRLCDEAARARLEFEAVLCTEGLAKDARGAGLLERLRGAGARISPASEGVIEAVSDTTTTQGIVALARRPPTGRERIEGAAAAGVPLVVVLHRANNPSNAGAMLRVAEAAGATAVVATRGSADVFSPKALRGSMGSAFRLPVWDGAGFEEVLGWCAARGIRPVAAAGDALPTHAEIDWTPPRAVVVGPEAGGLSPEEIRAVGECVRVPMREPVESLNVAVALAVVLYEAARQRGI